MSDITEAEAGHTSVDTAMVTTAETVAVTSGPVKSTRVSARRLIVAWAQVTSGAGATALTPRIRRGTVITDTLIDEANAQAVAASVNDRVVMMAQDETSGETADQVYSLTVQQAAATGNGTITQAGILVLELG